MKGYVDLHCHFLPEVDDGARDVEEGIAMCQELHRIGFDTVIATPHIRTALYENSTSLLSASYEAFHRMIEKHDEIPDIALAAEYFCDDVFWHAFDSGDILSYPGGKSVLVEFSTEQIPVKVEQRFFQMQVRGLRPVLAHPERCRPLLRNTKPIQKALEIGLFTLLDLLSLIGSYGTGPKRCAERMLKEGVYFAVSTDAHHLGDIELISQALERLERLVGKDEFYELLVVNPRQILGDELEHLQA